MTTLTAYLIADGPEHIAVAIQDLLICLEMVPASIAHRLVILCLE